jgi:hypothetical protein
MDNPSLLIKKALLRRIRRLMLACGSVQPDINRLLQQIEMATWDGDYDKLFESVNELCRSLTENQKDDRK